jgi:hypothetical protein
MLASRLLADGLLTRPDKASEAAVLSAKPSGACSRSTAWSFEGEGQPMAEPENGQGFVTPTRLIRRRRGSSCRQVPQTTMDH